MCTGDGIVKKKGGNVDSRCGETRWLKVEKERREREKKKRRGKKKKRRHLGTRSSLPAHFCAQ